MWYKKSNSLIYSMDNGSLLAHQLFAIGMSIAYVDESGRVNLVVYGSDVKKLLNRNSNSIYKRIRELCNKDSKESIFNWQVCIKDHEKGQYKMFKVVDDAKFENGKLTMVYNKSLTNLIINLEDDFTTMSVEETMKLRTIEALRLYELLKAEYAIKMRYRKLGDPNRTSFNITELKIFLGIIDIADFPQIKDPLEKDYPNYRLISELVQNADLDKRKGYGEFNKAVLSKAVKEINEKTSLKVEYEPIRDGNTVVGIEFFVSKEVSDKPQSLGNNSMYTIVERDLDISVGTTLHEPNPFLYLVFVMGICNIDENEELFSSVVTAEDIAQVLNREIKDVCHDLEKISNRSVDSASIYDWMTRKQVASGKTIVEQIVSDATYHDEAIEMKYNHYLNKYIVRLKEYYTGRINDLMDDVRNEIKRC